MGLLAIARATADLALPLRPLLAIVHSGKFCPRLIRPFAPAPGGPALTSSDSTAFSWPHPEYNLALIAATLFRGHIIGLALCFFA